MASVDTPAPSDGAPLLPLHTLDKRFGATHALKVVIGKRSNCGGKLFLFVKPTVGADVGAKAELDRPLPLLLAKRAGVIIIAGRLRDSPTRCASSGRAKIGANTRTASLEKYSPRRSALRARGVEWND